MPQTPEEWFSSIPKVTRFMMVAILTTTLLITFGFVNGADLYFSWHAVWHKFQIWRLVTPFFCFGKFGFMFLFSISLLYKFGSQLESNPYASGGGEGTGTPADYVYMLIFGGILMLFMGYLLDVPLLGPGLLFMILYVWSKRFPMVPITVMGLPGVQFYGVYLPFCMLTFDVLMGRNPILDLMGMAAGHMYYFLQVVLPLHPQHSYRLINTPKFLEHLLNEGGGPTAANPPPRAFGGAGNVLGGN